MVGLRPELLLVATQPGFTSIYVPSIDKARSSPPSHPPDTPLLGHAAAAQLAWLGGRRIAGRRASNFAAPSPRDPRWTSHQQRAAPGCSATSIVELAPKCTSE